MTKEEKKQLFHDLMTLDKAILVPKLAKRLKTYVKLIYVILLMFLALFAFVGLVNLLMMKLSVAIIQFVFVFIGFVIMRMFCEFLTAYDK